ncbi:MAG: GAF domain-containing protein [Candidatus Hermodarchaeota archaeon]
MTTTPHDRDLLTQEFLDSFLDSLFVCRIKKDIQREDERFSLYLDQSNKIARDQFNFKNKDVTDFFSLFNAYEIEKLRITIKRVISTHSSTRLTDFIHQSTDTAKIYNVDIIYIDPETILFSFHDISSRMALEKALMAAVKQIETAITIGNVVRDSEDLDETLRRALMAANDMVRGKYGAIFRVNEEENLIELVAEIGIPLKLRNLIQTRPISKDTHSFSGQCAYRNETVLVTNAISEMVTKEFHEIFKEFNMTDVLSCPISFNDRAIGVVQLTRVDDSHFTPQEIQLLESFATWLGLVIMDASHREEAVRLRKEAEFFIDLMTHDLTNLNTMSFLNLEDVERRVRKYVDDDVDGLFFLEGLKKSLKRTQELVSKVRTLSNARDIQQVDLVSINLLQSLNNAVYLLKEEYPNIEIKMIGAIEENMLVKATNMLEQLFLNILVTVFDIENHPLSIIRITIEPISGYYRINFDSHRIPPEVSERVLFGSIIDEIGGSRSDLSSLSHLIINSLVAKYKGNITFKHISEPEENDRISIDLPRVIN